MMQVRAGTKDVVEMAEGSRYDSRPRSEALTGSPRRCLTLPPFRCPLARCSSWPTCYVVVVPREDPGGGAWRPLARPLLVLAHLRNGDTYARLAREFGIGTTTAWRYVREAVDRLAALATTCKPPSNAPLGWPTVASCIWRPCWTWARADWLLVDRRSHAH